jgi:hypothetical protein
MKQKPDFAENFEKNAVSDRKELLNYCFYWEETPEGNSYWEKLCDK